MVGEKQSCYKNVPGQQTLYLYTMQVQMCNKIMRLSTPESKTSQRDGYSHNINSAIFLYLYVWC